jgi:hypothetical protein
MSNFKMYFIILTFFFSQRICGTCIIAYINNDSIIVGIDSRVVISHITGWTEDSTMCKVGSTNNIYYMFTGISDPQNLDIFDFSKIACETTNNIDSAVMKFTTLFTPALYRYLKTDFGKKSFENIPSPISIIFFGLQNKEPYMVSLYFTFDNLPNKSAFLNVEKQPISLTNTGYVLWGTYDAISSFLHTNQNYITQVSGVLFINTLINIQSKSTPKIVGGPTNIVCITQKGVEWIQKNIRCQIN